MPTLLQLQSDAPGITQCFCFGTKTIQTRISLLIYFCVPSPDILDLQLLSPSNKLYFREKAVFNVRHQRRRFQVQHCCTQRQGPPGQDDRTENPTLMGKAAFAELLQWELCAFWWEESHLCGGSGSCRHWCYYYAPFIISLDLPVPKEECGGCSSLCTMKKLQVCCPTQGCVNPGTAQGVGLLQGSLFFFCIPVRCPALFWDNN